MCMHGVFVVHVRPSTCADIRTSIRVSRFAIATYSPSHPLFSARRVQFPCPNNPIYTLDYSGNLRGIEGGFQPSPFPRLPGCCLCRTFSNPSSYVPASTAAKSPWPVRGSMPSTAIRSSWFCSNMADRHVLPFVSRLDDGTVFRYFLLLAIYCTRFSKRLHDAICTTANEIFLFMHRYIDVD